jgi:CubicO group peptidase (beta-lactamase class C family)
MQPDFWFYNNWDFDALGAIYRQATGEDIFQSFARRIAKLIDMEDFSVRDGQYILEPLSIHPAYPFMMSARDLARFGLLFLNDGRWNATQVIPAAWVKESTAATVAKYMAKRRRPLSQGWRTFVHNHADPIASIDMSVVPNDLVWACVGFLIPRQSGRELLWV